MPKHLSPGALAVIQSLIPEGATVVVIVATPEGTGVDSNIPDARTLKEFVLETGRNLETISYPRN